MLGGIGSHMPIRRNVWYSIDDDYRYALTATHHNWRDLAVDAAEDYHSNHDGWEATWPLEIVLYESENGVAVARFEVERETVPQFHAWEKPLAAAVGEP